MATQEGPVTKINVLPIIRGHLASLRDADTDRASTQDIALFFGVPLVIAGVGYLLKWRLYVDSLNALLAAFAIFAGLLLNLLLLIYTFSSDSVHPAALTRLRRTVVRQLHDNISFAILLSVSLV